jgi:tRNA pseudouridine38-40 synthase
VGDTSRWRLDVAYRGTAFHGFAAQPGQLTVAGEIADALATICRLDGPPRLTCAGRTDAGVHATAQVVHVDLPDPLPPTRGSAMVAGDLVRGLNKLLGDDVAVLAATAVSDRFDARHSARWRRYRYLIHEAAVAEPLLGGLAWQVPGPLDVRAMAQAIGSLLGSHDFRAFCRRVPGTGPDEPIVRLVTDASVEVVADDGGLDLVAGRLLRIEIEASSFCHQMVRSIVGQLVDLGQGRSNAADLVALLRSGSRQGAARPAPAAGLCLIGVGYDDPVGDGVGLPGVRPGA